MSTTMRPERVLLSGLVALLAALASAASGPGCGSSSSPSTAGSAGALGLAGQAGSSGRAGSSSTAGGGGGFAGSSAGAAGSVASPCGQPRPEGIPDSWVESSEWSCGCRLFLAPHGEDVEPLAWQPCDLSSVPGSEGYVCQVTADNFPADTNTHIGLAFDASDATKPPLLGFARHYLYPSGRRERRLIVARADGPIDFALSVGALSDEQGLEGCQLRPPPHNISARHGEFVATIEGKGTTKNPIGVLRRRNLSMHVRHGGKDFTDLTPGSGERPWEWSAC